MKYNISEILLNSTGITLSLNNDVDVQMGYITNTGFARLNGLTVNGTATLSAPNTTTKPNAIITGTGEAKTLSFSRKCQQHEWWRRHSLNKRKPSTNTTTKRYI